MTIDYAKAARAHRRALMKRLPDGLILLSAAPLAPRNGDVEFLYRQDSSFLWLTGVEEAGYALLLDPIRGEELLLCPKLTQIHAVWMGHIPSLAEARAKYGVERVASHDDLGHELRKTARGVRTLYADARSAALARKAAPRARIDRPSLEDALAELRVLKDETEIALLQKASVASGNGHRAAMRNARPGVYEYEIQADVEREFKRGGCRDVGYGSIIAGGAHSAVLHYTANDDKLRSGDLLLIDAGGEYHGYTADITRTFPVSGKFSRRQSDVYEIVLATQERSIDFARSGNTSMELQRRSEASLAEGLRDLGLMKGGIDELVESEAIRVFYPHGIGHTLGLDVHDVQGGKRRRLPKQHSGRLRFRARLEPGFVITIEPGLYFIDALLHDPELRKKHRSRIDFAKAETFLDFGGIRIEDNVVIQKQGPPRNLTDVPKSAKDVEAACAA